MTTLRSSSNSTHRQRLHSLSTRTVPSNVRRNSGYSLHSAGEHGPNTPASATAEVFHGNNPTITEEINEIKRYEDFTTIDWVQDEAQEQARRRARKKRRPRFWDQEGTWGWRRKVGEAYDAGQAWLVVTIVGAVIGLNAGFLNIVTEWLADIKLGYCTTGFYLNEAFCCWEAEHGTESI